MGNFSTSSRGRGLPRAMRPRPTGFQRPDPYTMGDAYGAGDRDPYTMRMGDRDAYHEPYERRQEHHERRQEHHEMRQEGPGPMYRGGMPFRGTRGRARGPSMRGHGTPPPPRSTLPPVPIVFYLLVIGHNL